MLGRPLKAVSGCGTRALALLPGLLVIGCAQISLGEASPSFENIEKARMSKTAPVAIGEFGIDPKLDPERDKRISVRSNKVSSPAEGSFAQYLRQALIADFKASGLFDPASSTRINGFLTESVLEVPVDRGSASLGARFVVARAGKTVYEKELKASSKWQSSFVGAEAIPAGINHYTALFHRLVGKLLDDPDYQAVNRKD